MYIRNMLQYSNRVVNPIFRRGNIVNWALFFWIQATSSKHPTQSVNDFCEKLDWDEDIYPRDTLLRQYPRVTGIFYRNIKEALEREDQINSRWKRAWITFTFEFWRDAHEFYSIEGCPIESYLDFVQAENETRKTIKDIVNSLKSA